MDKPIIQKSSQFFKNSEKHSIIQEYLCGGISKREIWEKYTGQLEEHGGLLKWMRQLGYVNSKNCNIVENSSNMPRKNNSEDESFEISQLKKRISQLENQLKDAELKAIAFSTMVDIAEKEFKVPIRKKLNTKP